MSMKLQNQPVDERAHAHDHLAEDVNVMTVLRVDGAIPQSSGRQEEPAIALRDVEPYGETALWRRGGAGLRQRAGHGDLSLSLGPDDRVDAGLDDAAGIGLECD